MFSEDEVIPQSGVIPYQFDKNNQLQIMLVTSKLRGVWILPKGKIELDLTSMESASKEAFEEAGVKGKIENQVVGTYNYSKFGNDYSVEFFPLEIETVLEEWDEMDFRRRELFEINDAIDNVYDQELRDILIDFQDYIQGKE
ncbi:MAG: NUDIX domain-containing protein [Calditrichaeota bacterium]|nr:MAG: NUDIX domain-containing protein [Calditrichota bacterium]